MFLLKLIMSQPNEVQNEQNKPYLRQTLIPIPESESQVLNIQESKILEKKCGIERIKEFSTVNLSHLYFYHYNCESIKLLSLFFIIFIIFKNNILTILIGDVLGEVCNQH